MTTLAVHRVHPPFWLMTVTAVSTWIVAWFALAPAVQWLTNELLGLDTAAGFGAAIEFFLFDLPKVLLLLVGVVTAVSFLRSFVSPDRVRHALAGRNAAVGATAAAGFGVITPFCTVSNRPPGRRSKWPGWRRRWSRTPTTARSWRAAL